MKFVDIWNYFVGSRTPYWNFEISDAILEFRKILSAFSGKNLQDNHHRKPSKSICYVSKISADFVVNSTEKISCPKKTAFIFFTKFRKKILFDFNLAKTLLESSPYLQKSDSEVFWVFGIQWRPSWNFEISRFWHLVSASLEKFARQLPSETLEINLCSPKAHSSKFSAKLKDNFFFAVK